MKSDVFICCYCGFIQVGVKNIFGKVCFNCQKYNEPEDSVSFKKKAEKQDIENKNTILKYLLDKEKNANKKPSND